MAINPADNPAEPILDTLQARSVELAFASVWSEADLERVRAVLSRTMSAADNIGISLYLDCGTLLGYIREGRILPWDDDIDLAVASEDCIELLRSQLNTLGLSVTNPPLWKGTGVKVFDPCYGKPISPDCSWTWPNLDIFFLIQRDGEFTHRFLGKKFAEDPLRPGIRVLFETVECWLPQRPTYMLDTYYKDWRTVEKSNHLDHRREAPIERVYERGIQTDSFGRKL